MILGNANSYLLLGLACEGTTDVILAVDLKRASRDAVFSCVLCEH